MLATTIEVQNAFAPALCFAKVISRTDGQNTRVIKLRVIKGPNARDQIAFCAFHSFLMNAGLLKQENDRHYF